MCAHVPRATAAQSAALHRGALQRRVVLARVLHTKLVQCAAKHGLTRRQCRKVVSRYDALNMLHVRVLFQKNLNYLHSSPSTPPPMLQPPPRPSQASHGASGGHGPRPAPGGTDSSTRRTTSTKSSVAALTHQMFMRRGATDAFFYYGAFVFIGNGGLLAVRGNYSAILGKNRATRRRCDRGAQPAWVMKRVQTLCWL